MNPPISHSPRRVQRLQEESQRLAVPRCRGDSQGDGLALAWALPNPGGGNQPSSVPTGATDDCEAADLAVPSSAFKAAIIESSEPRWLRTVSSVMAIPA